jgi:hypothetical protein
MFRADRLPAFCPTDSDASNLFSRPHASASDGGPSDGPPARCSAASLSACRWEGELAELRRQLHELLDRRWTRIQHSTAGHAASMVTVAAICYDYRHGDRPGWARGSHWQVRLSTPSLRPSLRCTSRCRPLAPSRTRHVAPAGPPSSIRVQLELKVITRSDSGRPTRTGGRPASRVR